MSSVIERINNDPSSITKEDFDWIIPEFLNHFASKLSMLTKYVYGSSDSDVPYRAFREQAIITLENGLNTYLFKSQHWRNGYKVQYYMAACLNRLSDNVKKDYLANKKINIPVCPACKIFNQKEYLLYDGKQLRCNFCTNNQDRLRDRIKRVKFSDRDFFEYELRLRKVFSLHSRQGYRCPSCSRFIPKSFLHGQRVSCPYDRDCDWFGHLEELEAMSHPLGLSANNFLSISSPLSDDGTEVSFQDLIEDNNVIKPDAQLELKEKCEKEINVLQDVIDIQYKRLLRYPKYKVIKKILMYQAFRNMIKSYPNDMVSYLVHQNTPGDLPIQSRIFQEFIKVVENALPLEIFYDRNIVEIYSLQDSRLDLFIGFSEFETYIRKDGTIPNVTKEHYIGGRKIKDFGPCFIGQLVDIKTENNDSLLQFVEYYTFSQIQMKNNVLPGVKVTVSHFRIPSHYEMNGLVYLQRIRRKIVDSVYQRLYGKKREAGEK